MGRFVSRAAVVLHIVPNHPPLLLLLFVLLLLMYVATHTHVYIIIPLCIYYTRVYACSPPPTVITVTSLPPWSLDVYYILGLYIIIVRPSVSRLYYIILHASTRRVYKLNWFIDAVYLQKKKKINKKPLGTQRGIYNTLAVDTCGTCCVYIYI